MTSPTPLPAASLSGPAAPSGSARVPGPGPRPGSLALDLGGRTALVTGAASGIGRACALR
ncbi:3-hydroxybutyrate dehydrogenase, partial [Streptomyces nogalater]